MPWPQKGTVYTLYNGPPDKGGIIIRAGCLKLSIILKLLLDKAELFSILLFSELVHENK